METAIIFFLTKFHAALRTGHILIMILFLMIEANIIREISIVSWEISDDIALIEKLRKYS